MASAELESAIPAHLVEERTQPLRLPTPEYIPPFPAYASRFSESIKGVVIAILGVQHKDKPTSSRTALSKLVSYVENDTVAKGRQPLHWQLASSTDSVGAYNEVVIAYWKRKTDFEEWKTQCGFESWWQGLNTSADSNGWFKEIFYPPADRFETVFSATTTPEGVAHMHDNFSGPIREHVYWGSMRDRLSASQRDGLKGKELKQGTGANAALAQQSDTSGTKEGDTKTRRIRVSGQKNLAVIRSGQDWSDTTPHERELYLNTMHPVLIRGMDFLRDQGAEVGCISNRFMTVLNPNTLSTEGVEKTYGLGYFDDLASLEGWSKQHKTHLDIFGRFLQYAKELEGNVSLRLFHEVLVLEPEQQEFEYIGCHGQTGMLAAL